MKIKIKKIIQKKKKKIKIKKIIQKKKKII
jgi:hypothetical protein